MDAGQHPIAAHVERLLEDPLFRASERQKKLLRYLADRTVANDGPPLQEEIAVHVFGLSQDFDPAVDSRVRVEVLRLRRTLDAYSCTHPTIAERLFLPRGDYTLRIEVAPAPAILPRQEERGVPILIAVHHPRDAETDEQLTFTLNEVLRLCARSPTVAPDKLTLHLIDVVNGVDIAAEARRIGANATLLLHARGHGADFTLCATAVAMPSCQVLASLNTRADDALQTTGDQRESAAHAVAGLIADPITGIGSALGDTTRNNSVFAAVQSGYAYMRTQNIELAEQAWNQLDTFLTASRHDATALALSADMWRVLEIAGRRGGTCHARAVDLAERAVLVDPECNTARLALGYAHLAVGAVDEAERCAEHLKRSVLFGSLHDDARLLSILSDASFADMTAPKATLPTTSTIMGLASSVIHLMDRNNMSHAAEALDDPCYDSLYWTHLFNTLVMDELGEYKRAEKSVRQLDFLQPEFRLKGEAIIRGFFGQRVLGERLIESCHRHATKG